MPVPLSPPVSGVAPTTAAASHAPHARVLIVEDHPDGAESLAALFGLFGWVTRVHPTGHGVPAAVREFGPDCVVLDLSLPGRPGVQVAAELAALDPKPRVVVYTGQHNAHQLAGLAAPLVDAVLLKPGDPAELVRLVAGEGPPPDGPATP